MSLTADPSKDIHDLIPEMQDKCNLVINECKKRGVEILVFQTFRSLQYQARIWRQSRTKYEILEKVDYFKTHGYDYLADILTMVGPQHGPHVTNSCCGESWHSFKEAFDAVIVVDKKAVWDDSHPHWKIYGEVVQSCGLTWGGGWKSFTDFPHAQLRAGANPMRTYTPADLKNILKTYGLI